MSSTNRGSIRNPQDYYYTPLYTIQEFWKRLCETEDVNIEDFSAILDPCAGGDENRPCAYPAALRIFDFEPDNQIADVRFWTVDIREDSKATYKEDYLKRCFGEYPLIISNPPFSLLEKFVEKALTELKPGGYLIYLLRLNATGAQCRKEFWKKCKPKSIYVHSKRPSFCKGSTDSNEYAHFVWQRGYNGETRFYWV